MAVTASEAWCAGLLPDPAVSLGAMGIAFNTHAWIFMLGNGMAAAASTRVSNALGANQPDDAKLSAEVRSLARPTVVKLHSRQCMYPGTCPHVSPGASMLYDCTRNLHSG